MVSISDEGRRERQEKLLAEQSEML